MRLAREQHSSRPARLGLWPQPCRTSAQPGRGAAAAGGSAGSLGVPYVPFITSKEIHGFQLRI